jgi:hypothetical protein
MTIFVTPSSTKTGITPRFGHFSPPATRSYVPQVAEAQQGIAILLA